MGDEVLLEFCSNCKRDVPAANFVMHAVHCQRNLALCTKCDEPIPLVEFAVHNAKMHVSVECTACGQQLEKMKLADHLKTSCSLRAMCCSFCDIDTEAKHIAEHENYCGSRTEKCGECGEFVMLKYKQLHLDSNHNFLKLEDEPGPTASWNKPRQSASLLNDLSRRRKVMNAEQDVSIRPNSSNRLSPSKRTNDMPQVNSAAAVIVPKALHKPTIKKEEPERVSEASPYHTAVSMLRSLDVSGEMVALPCEFCDAMVPANQLVVHETGCRPDLACFKPETTLPCELCGGMYAPHALQLHQSLCQTQRDVRVNELGLRAREPRKLLNVTPGRPVANITPVQEVPEPVFVPVTYMEPVPGCSQDPEPFMIDEITPSSSDTPASPQWTDKASSSTQTLDSDSDASDSEASASEVSLSETFSPPSPAPCPESPSEGIITPVPIARAWVNRPPGQIAPGQKRQEENRARRSLDDGGPKRKRKKAPAPPDQDYGPLAAADDMDAEEFSDVSKAILNSLADEVATKELQRELQISTIGQSECAKWMEARKFRLTASKFGEVYSRQSGTPCHNLVKRLLYNTMELRSPDIKYGRIHEKTAISKYEEAKGVVVDKCGLFVDMESPFLGASPDGLVGDDGLVEVKCVPSIGKMTLDEAIVAKKNKNFLLDKVGNSFSINKNNHYYHQIIGQLHITGRKYCDLIVYADNAFFIERIFPDDALWNQMMTKLTRFYLDCLLPEITDPRIPRRLKARNPPSFYEAVAARDSAKAAKEAERAARKAARRQ